MDWVRKSYLAEQGRTFGTQDSREKGAGMPDLDPFFRP